MRIPMRMRRIRVWMWMMREGLDDKDHGLGDEGRSLDEEDLSLERSEEEAVPEGQQQAALVTNAVVGEPLGIRYEALRCRELAVKEDRVHNTFEVGQCSGSVPEPEGPERVSVLRQPTLTTWIDLDDGKTYIDIPTYPPPEPPVQTPSSLEWSFGSLHVSPAPFVVLSPISSPLISLTVPSPIASPVATLTATISVDEDQFLKGQLGMRSSSRDIDLGA
nr:hypothetical protein [Tanacetum cinerariifolium]